MTNGESYDDPEDLQSPISANMESWQVSELNENRLTLKMKFKKPLDVSQSDDADRVFIKFDLSTLDQESEEPIPDGYLTSSMVPTQVEDETETPIIDSVGNSAK